MTNTLILNARAYQLIPRSTRSEKDGSTSLPRMESDRNQSHPAIQFNKIFANVSLEIPDEPPLNPEKILFHREISGRAYSLHAKIMGVGKIADVLGLKDVIPHSGPIDVELLGAVLIGYAQRLNWIGRDYGCARALCKYQKNIPQEPRFDRLRFLFPGTIVFDEELGICIPMVVKKDGVWGIAHRNILDDVIVGIDLYMT